MEMVGGDANVVPGFSSYGWAGVWSTLASLLFLWSMVQEHLPFQLQDHLSALARRALAAVSPYVTITIDEHAADSFGRSEAYLAAEAYLGATCAGRASRLRAELPAGGSDDRVSLAVDDNVEVIDAFHGAGQDVVAKDTDAPPQQRHRHRAYCLTFHRRHRAPVEADYLPHVLAEGRAVMALGKRRRRRRAAVDSMSSSCAYVPMTLALGILHDVNSISTLLQAQGRQGNMHSRHD